MGDAPVQQVNGENYRWWRQAGWQWYAELQLRRLSDPLYDRQEALLKEFFHDLAARHVEEEGRPLRVLEYGCGFGRHTRYLHQIDGLEIYGCDQSSGMLEVAGTLLFGRFPELEERLQLIEPQQRLPWEGGFFDVVFTVSVLMHVAPEDLEGRVAELRRLADRLVLNVEFPSPPHSFLWDDVHNGCWLHDLVGAHRAAGPCEMEVDADALAPGAAVYRTQPTPADGGVRVLRGGEWHEGQEAGRKALLDAVLDYGRFCRDRAQSNIEQERALNRRLAAANEELKKKERQLVSLRRTRAVRVANWLRRHALLRRAAQRAFDGLAAVRRGVRRLLGGASKEPAAAGEANADEVKTTEAVDE